MFQNQQAVGHARTPTASTAARADKNVEDELLFVFRWSTEFAWITSGLGGGRAELVEIFSFCFPILFTN
jgi:hypothetical protein